MIIEMESVSPASPLARLAGIHSSFAGPKAEVCAHYGITEISKAGSNAPHCHGRLIYMDLRPIAAPPPVVAAAPLTALEWSARVARDTPPTDVVNTVCGAVDGTGRQKKGFNGHGTAWDALHPALRQIMSLVEQLEPWGTTNCAEIQAVDEMLRAGSVLRNIRLYSRYPATAHLKLPCDNCQGWLERADGCFKIRRA